MKDDLDQLFETLARAPMRLSPVDAVIEHGRRRRRNTRLLSAAGAAVAVAAIGLGTTALLSGHNSDKRVSINSPSATTTVTTSPSATASAATSTAAPPPAPNTNPSSSPSANLTPNAGGLGTYVANYPREKIGQPPGGGLALFSAADDAFIRVVAEPKPGKTLSVVRHGQVGDWVYFLADAGTGSVLERTHRTGGAVETIAQVPVPQIQVGSPTLSDDGSRLAYLDNREQGVTQLTSRIHVLDVTHPGKTAAFDIARSVTLIGWLPDDSTLVMLSTAAADPNAQPDVIDELVTTGSGSTTRIFTGCSIASGVPMTADVDNLGRIAVMNFACVASTSSPQPAPQIQIVGGAQENRPLTLPGVEGYKAFDVQYVSGGAFMVDLGQENGCNSRRFLLADGTATLTRSVDRVCSSNGD